MREMEKYRQEQQRQELIAAGRALTIDADPPHTRITSETRFYVVSFGGKQDLPVLHQAGIYRGCAERKGGARSGPNPSRLLAQVTWDGDNKTSFHVANRIGLSDKLADPSDAPNFDPTVLALDSLDDIEVIDKRPPSQRSAHPIPQ